MFFEGYGLNEKNKPIVTPGQNLTVNMSSPELIYLYQKCSINSSERFVVMALYILDSRGVNWSFHRFLFNSKNSAEGA